MLVILSTLLIVQALAWIIVIGACRAAAAERRAHAGPGVGHSRPSAQPAAVLTYAPIPAHRVQRVNVR